MYRVANSDRTEPPLPADGLEGAAGDLCLHGGGGAGQWEHVGCESIFLLDVGQYITHNGLNPIFAQFLQFPQRDKLEFPEVAAVAEREMDGGKAVSV